MSFVVLGISHKHAPVSLREKVVFSPDSYKNALYRLSRHPLVMGCMLLSTCNRTEIYLSVESINFNQVKQDLTTWLVHYHALDSTILEPYLYWYEEQNAIKHLMRVASGLDSMILGESQILGQVKQAFIDAKSSQTINSELNRLLQKTFSVAKRIRTETKIGSSTVSVAFAACLLARELFQYSNDVTVMLVGAGKTIELVARYLKQHNLKKVIVANRTKEKAKAITTYINAEVISLTEITQRLQDTDIIISSTASPLPIIGKGLVERILPFRQHKKMLFVDIAVPRDVEPEVADLPNIHLYTVDDLQNIIQDNLAQREIAAQEAEHIIEQEYINFNDWLQERYVIDTVVQFRQSANQIKEELEAKALHQLKQGKDAEMVMHQLAHKLTRRLIHSPTKLVKQIASEQQHSCKQNNVH